MNDNNAKFEGSNWSRLDQFVDYIPFVSILSNAVDLGMKEIAETNLRQAKSQTSTTAKPIKQHYWTHIKNKSGWRIFFGCIPGIGNAILLAADLVRGIRYLAVSWNPESLQSKDEQFQRDFLLTHPKDMHKYKQYVIEGLQEEFFGEDVGYYNFGGDSFVWRDAASGKGDDFFEMKKDENNLNLGSDESVTSEEKEQFFFKEQEDIENRGNEKVPFSFEFSDFSWVKKGKKNQDSDSFEDQNFWVWHSADDGKGNEFFNEKKNKEDPIQVFKNLESQGQVEFLNKDFNNIVKYLQYAKEDVLDQEPFNDIKNLRWTSVSHQVKKIEENQKNLFEANDKAKGLYVLKQIEKNEDFLKNQDQEFQLKVLQDAKNKEALLQYASDNAVNHIVSTTFDNLKFASVGFQLNAINKDASNLEQVSDEAIQAYIRNEKIKEKSDLNSKDVKALRESRKRALKQYEECNEEEKFNFLKVLKKESDFDDIVKYFTEEMGSKTEQVQKLNEKINQIAIPNETMFNVYSKGDSNKKKKVLEHINKYELNKAKEMIYYFVDGLKSSEEQFELFELLIDLGKQDLFPESVIKDEFISRLCRAYKESKDKKSDKLFEIMQNNKYIAAYLCKIFFDLTKVHQKALVDAIIERKVLESDDRMDLLRRLGNFGYNYKLETLINNAVLSQEKDNEVFDKKEGLSFLKSLKLENLKKNNTITKIKIEEVKEIILKDFSEFADTLISKQTNTTSVPFDISNNDTDASWVKGLNPLKKDEKNK